MAEHDTTAEEFQQSLSRFKKALFKTVVYKRELLDMSEDQSERLNSSTVDFASSHQTEECGELEEAVDAGTLSLDQVEQTQAIALKSPIQTTPRNGLSTLVCCKCRHMQESLTSARLQIKQQDATIIELSKNLLDTQKESRRREEEVKTLQGKLDGLFAQHLQVLSDYKSLMNTCQVLERQHTILQKSFSDAENLNETLQKKGTKVKPKTPVRARPLDEHFTFDCAGERRVQKCPSLSQTTNNRRSESLKLGSQDRHSHIHSPLGRASPVLRRKKESHGGRMFLTSVRQRIGSAMLEKTPKKL